MERADDWRSHGHVHHRSGVGGGIGEPCELRDQQSVAELLDEPAGVYYARVIAFNLVGPSPPSDEISFTVNGAAETNVSGRWVGVAPFGLIFNTDAAVCDAADDLVFDLIQSGSIVTGTVTATVRASKSNAGCTTFGDGAPKSITNGAFIVAPTSAGVSTARLILSQTIFNGQAAGGRITGTVGTGDGNVLGVFTVVRQ